MRRFCNIWTGTLLTLLFAAGIASLFPITGDWFKKLPYWLICPLRTVVAIFLVFIFTGFLLDSGILQKLFRKK